MSGNSVSHPLENVVKKEKSADLSDKKECIFQNTNGKKQTIVIREMQVKDVSAVAVLEAMCFSEPWSEQAFLDALKQTEALLLVAVGMDDKPLGYCGIYLSADEGEITNVAVCPDYRKRGIADAILTAVFAKAQKRGTQTVYLEVRESNISAQKLYEKHGFVSCGIRKNFYRKPTEHAIVMCSDLTRRINE